MTKRAIIFLILITSIFAHCWSPKNSITNDYTINLKWSKSFDNESKETVTIGLSWYLSYMGALCSQSMLDKAMLWNDDKTFSLALDKCGFTAEALSAYSTLISKWKDTEGYKNSGSIDLGEFYLLTFNSSWHYYAITGVATDFNTFLDKYDFDQPIQLYSGESSISYGDRVVYFGSNDTILESMAYYAVEGTGSLKEHTFQPVDFEVFDFMPNGQPRFAIYGTDGKLKESATKRLGKGGKPSKCMWCHESSVLPSFKKTKDEKLELFTHNILNRKQILSRFQEDSNSANLFDSLAHHRNFEFSFASYLECTPMQIAEELDIPIDNVKNYISNLECKTTPHFPEFECYYDRADIPALQHATKLAVPTHMWEESEYEPNLID